MELTVDELAGVLDVFGALSRAELERALSELAFKHAETVDDPQSLIDDAVASYHVVEFDPADWELSGDGSAASNDGDGGERLFVPGPAAFPELPDGAEDLPHILNVPDRSVDRSELADAVADRFREETVVAVRSEDPGAIEHLLDVSYELEVWGSVDVSGARERLADCQADRQ